VHYFNSCILSTPWFAGCLIFSAYSVYSSFVFWPGLLLAQSNKGYPTFVEHIFPVARLASGNSHWTACDAPQTHAQLLTAGLVPSNQLHSELAHPPGQLTVSRSVFPCECRPTASPWPAHPSNHPLSSGAPPKTNAASHAVSKHSQRVRWPEPNLWLVLATVLTALLSVHLVVSWCCMSVSDTEQQLPTDKLHLLCGMTAVQEYVRQTDYIFYQTIVGILVPDVLRPIPS